MDGKTTESIIKQIHEKLDFIGIKPISSESINELCELIESIHSHLYELKHLVDNFSFYASYRTRYFETLNQLNETLK